MKRTSFVDNQTKALEESHERLLTVCDSLDAAVYVADMETYEILFVNKYLRDQWGDVEGQPCWRILQAGQNGPCDYCTNEKLLNAAGEPNGVCSWEFQDRAMDRWCEMRDRAIRWVDGRIVRLGIVIDITESRRAEADLVKLQKAVDTSGEVIFMTDREGTITFINPEFTRLYGYSSEDIVGKVTPRILKSDTMAARDYEEFWRTILSKQVAKGEWVNKCRNGDLIDIEGSANPILDEKEEIVGFLAIQRDISKRKRVESEIRQRNIELEALNAVSSTVCQSLDLNQIISAALDNVLSLELLGDEADGILFLIDEGVDTLSLVAQRFSQDSHPCILNPPRVGECLCGLAAQRGETIISTDCRVDERHTRCWTEMPSHQDISIPLKVRGKILGAMGMRLPASRQITPGDIKLLESVAGQISVAIENAQLRELRDRAIIDERERIARELHDRFSQLLGYVNTKAMAVRLMLLNRQYDVADQNLLQLEEAARGLFVDVRSAILGLKMAGLSGEGLKENLTEYADQFSQLSGLQIDVAMNSKVENLNLDLESELQMFRIVQEALNNVHKHASASQAWVSGEITNGELELAIVDNGLGFDPGNNQFNDHSHFGLRMMRERAEAIGADFDIVSKINSGTRVVVRVKVKED